MVLKTGFAWPVRLLLLFAVSCSVACPVLAGGKLPSWQLIIYTNSPRLGDPFIASVDSSSVLVHSEQITTHEGFFIQNTFSLTELSGGISISGSDYLDYWYVSDGEQRYPIKILENNQHITQSYTGIPINPTSNTVLVIPSVSALVRVEDPGAHPKGDRLIMSLLPPELSSIADYPEVDQNSLKVQCPVMEYELDKVPAFQSSEFPGYFSLYQGGSSYISATGKISTLPEFKQEVGAQAKKSAKKVVTDSSMDVALVVHYLPVNHDAPKTRQYITRMWLISRKNPETESSGKKKGKGASKKKQQKKQQAFGDSNVEAFATEGMQLLFIPAEATRKVTANQLRKVKKSTLKKGEGRWDITTVDQLVHRLSTEDKVVTKSEAPTEAQIKSLMEIIEMLVTARDEVQIIAAFGSTRSHDQQRKKKTQAANLWNMDLILLDAFHSVVRFYIARKLTDKVTTQSERAASIQYVPLKYVAQIYPALFGSITNTEIRTGEMVGNIHTAIGFMVYQLLLWGDGYPALTEPIHDIWEDLRAVVIFVVNHGGGLLDGMSALNMINDLMILAKKEGDEEMIFLLARYMDRIKSTEGKVDPLSVRTRACEVFEIAWEGLEPLLVQQDISIDSLRQLSSMAASIGINTQSWDRTIDRYERAKYLKLIEVSEQRLHETESWATRLLDELGREQARLDKLRQQRNQKKEVKKHTGHSVKQAEKTEIATENPPLEELDSLGPVPEKELWEQLYDQGVAAVGSDNIEDAIKLFQQALDTKPKPLDEAKIFSTLADIYFVPGETRVKEVLRMDGKARRFQREMELAYQTRNYPKFHRGELNKLGGRLVKEGERLIEPVKQAGKCQASAVERLGHLGSKEVMGTPGEEEALRLLLILRQESEQSRKMLNHYKSAMDALVVTYQQRRELIRELGGNKKAWLTDEAKLQRRLKTTRQKITTEDSEAEPLPEKSDKGITDSLNRNYETMLWAMTSFDAAEKKAIQLEKTWKRPGKRRAKSAPVKITPANWQNIRQSFIGGKMTLRCKAQKQVITMDFLQQSLARVIKVATPPPEPDSSLLDFISTLGLSIVDVDDNHFCMFNAIVAWLMRHPQTAQQINHPQTGQELFFFLAPIGVALGQMFPGNPIMNSIAAAFEVDTADPQLWGTSDMLQALVSPLLGIPILVLTPQQFGASGVIGTLYDDAGTVQTVAQENISSVLTADTMVLFHSGAHWQVLLPQQVPHLIIEASGQGDQNQKSTMPAVHDGNWSDNAHNSRGGVESLF